MGMRGYMGKNVATAVIAAAFETDLRKTFAAAKKGNFADAQSAFAKAEERCNQCRAKFRD